MSILLQKKNVGDYSYMSSPNIYYRAILFDQLSSILFVGYFVTAPLFFSELLFNMYVSIKFSTLLTDNISNIFSFIRNSAYRKICSIYCITKIDTKL